MRLFPAAVVFGAAGVGYVMTHDDLAQQLSPASWVSHEGAAGLGSSAPTIEELATAPPEQIIAVPGPQSVDLADVLRFDLTPKNITERWSRVSTGLTDVRYQGYRVPLVTGSEPADLAGSLTYYFDSHPKLRRITFLGTTGDPQRVTDFVIRQFGMKRHNDGNSRITAYRSRYPYAGTLHVAPAEVVDRHFTTTNYRVELTLER